MRKTQGLALIRVGITLMWIVILPLLFLFCSRGLGMPTRLALLLMIPLALIWVPTSYPLAIAGNERHQRMEGAALPQEAIAAFGALGLVTGALTVATLFLDVFIRARAYVAAAVVMLIAGGCIWLAARLVRRALNALWTHEPPAGSQRA